MGGDEYSPNMRILYGLCKPYFFQGAGEDICDSTRTGIFKDTGEPFFGGRVGV